MQPVIIPRSTKRPGLIQRAKTYRLEWNAKGLYLICLGNATSDTPRGNLLAQAVAQKILDGTARKFERQAVETENRLEREGLDALAQTPNSRFIPKAALQLFEFARLGNGLIRVNIKGGGKKLSLIVHPDYGPQLESIRTDLKTSG